MAKYITSIYLEEELRQQYHKRAVLEDRSVNWLMNKALQAYLTPPDNSEKRELADA